MPGVTQPSVSTGKEDATASAVNEAPSQVAGSQSQQEDQSQNGGAGGEKKEDQAEAKKSEGNKDGGNQQGDFDAMKFMDWSDGIGSLPGSNLKFKVNEFGLMEMVADETPEPIMVDSAVGVNTTDPGMISSQAAHIADSPSTLVKREDDPIQKCENCGKFGYLSEFCKSGRFCSQTCVGAYAGKKNLNRKHSLLTPKILMSLKKKKKKHRLAVDVGDNGHKLMCLTNQDGSSAVEDEKPFAQNQNRKSRGFDWQVYLDEEKAVGAPARLFKDTVTPSAFRVGMKLEAVDRKNTVLICVATVADTLGDKVLVHFDGWEDAYDYWCDITSPYIHPVGWCQENARLLSPPCDWKDVEGFTWEDYLAQTKSQAVPARAFKPRPPIGFEPGMRVEVVDRRNPILVRVATIKEVREHQVLIHFDGWPEMYDYWLDDDSPDIKPPHWCARTGHALQPPFVDEELVAGSCPTPGCNGVGHIKGAKYVGHHSAFGCPYSTLNMNKESTLQDRLGSTRIEEGPAAPLFQRMKSETGEIRKCPTPGCDSSGHITGKFTSHHRLSGCPLYEKNILKMKAELAGRSPGRPGRGRKRKNFDIDSRRSREQNGQHGDGRRVDPTALLHEGIHQSVFMSVVPPTPSQEQPPYWEHHAKLLPGVDHLGGNEVKRWSIEQVASFVSTLPGCRDYEKVFREQQIDGEAFLLLNQADIVRIMSIKLGPALKIFNSILMFKQSCDT
nr:hypothetical protein BaRGS_030731 [Batillaria attramentaria]